MEINFKNVDWNNPELQANIKKFQDTSTDPKIALQRMEKQFWSENTPLIKDKADLGDAQRVWRDMVDAVNRGIPTDEAYNQIAAPWQKQKATAIAAATTTNVPGGTTGGGTTAPITYNFDKTAFETENADILKAINDTIAGGQSTLTPEMTAKWQDTLKGMYQPYQDQAIKDINLSSNLASPSSYGSSVQGRNVADAIAQSQQAQGQQALSMAQNDVTNKNALYQNAVAKKFDLGSYYEQMKQASSADSAKNYWLGKQRDWTLQDQNTNQMNEDRNYYRQSDLAKSLAEMSKPRQPQWYDYALQIASPFVGGLGTGVGYNLFKGATGLGGANNAASSLVAGSPEWLKAMGIRS